MNMKKKICILGSTGSIGTQTLEVISEHPDLFEAYVLTANSRADLLIRQAKQYQPCCVVIADESKYEYVREALADEPIQVYAGADALCPKVHKAMAKRGLLLGFNDASKGNFYLVWVFRAVGNKP